MKHLFSSSRRQLRRSPAWYSALLLPALLLGQPHRAQAQTQTFPRAESFQNNTATGFTLGGSPTSATLTAASGIDPNGSGYLRLTSNGTDQSGFAIDQSSFPAPNGFSISFEFFAYGGTGADGFSVFLVDADQTTAATFKPGASGGSLGYAQKTIAPISNGVPFGYIGIGIDEFGNYSNPTEGRVGGTGFISNAVAIRGPGNGQSTTDYPYLTGSPSLPFSLAVPTVRAQAGTADYRRAYIDVVPVTSNGVTSYRITVRIQHGTAVATIIRDVLVPTPPKNLRIGFAGSTGGSTNYHEIRSLAIRQLPHLEDDAATTAYNQAVSFNALSNDLFSYAPYAPGTIDLDINTAGTQSTLQVPEGTFSVTADGLVTFTPIGTFAGVVTLPYTADDAIGQTAFPANMVITVKGADLTTSISGPTSANPGARITYSVNTSNLGALQALNVVPTLRLPANLTNVAVSSGAYDAVSGLVTFSAVASLAAGAAPIANTATFTAPASGTVTGTAVFVRPPGVPDPVTANDAASITTAISGIANAAGVCATPGKDGPVSLTSTATPNTYYPGTASAAAGATSISVGTPVGSPTPIAAGDLLLVMQMQGADINTTNSSAYGSGTTSGSGNLSTNYTAGTYEYVTAAGPVAGGAVPLTTGLVNPYSNLLTGGSPRRVFQVVRVPQYSSLTVSGDVTGAAWNGTSGGILALDVAGQTTFAAGSSLTMTSKGFRGGGFKQYTGNIGSPFPASTDYVTTASNTLVGAHGTKGEGIAGGPRFINNGSVPADSLSNTYVDGSLGRGAPGNAGGGGSDGTPATNAANTGGGGGGNGGDGGTGGAFNFGQTNVSATGGVGGAAVGSASSSRLFLGGGGGAGSNDDASTSSGGNGGGIIIFRTGLVSGTGSIVANGDAGSSAANDGGGGGGAGGAVLIAVQGLAGVGNLTVQATGGVGGNATANPGTTQFGSGGGGGGGQVYANGALNAASTAVGGASGLSAANLGILAANGATAGGASTITNNAIIPAAVASVGACLPTLSVAMSANPNSVPRYAGSSTGPVNPALYTLNITNTGGTVTGMSVTGTLDNLFLYDNTYTPIVTIELADGTSVTPTGYAVPTTATSQPVFSGFTIPAGATLLITFRATIDAAAQNNVAYQATAAVSYDNPLRTTSLTTVSVQPGGNYAGGADTSLGTAAGSNYAAASSTSEDVTIVMPLPVSLTRFTVVAQRLDAQLRWTTASERNNDRFVVERSLNGSSFDVVGSVRGQGTSAKSVEYEFIDASAARLTAAGQPLYYRLRQVDFDGTSTYSPVRSVAFGAKGAITVYPNPAGSAATLDLSGLAAGSYQVQVLDLTGRYVATYSLSGAARHALDLHALAAGTYVVRVQGAAVSQSLLLTKE